MSTLLYAQQNTNTIKVELDTLKSTLKIQQKIVFFNKSKDTLTSIFLHNWANSFRNNETPLGKRFIDDYKKDFYFSKEKERGKTKIYNLVVNNEQTSFKEVDGKPDILEVLLNRSILPNKSVKISTTYTVKIPDAKFTGYGKTATGYHLRFWYITPAVYQNGWQIMSNLNMDDLYQDVADFSIEVDVPKKFVVESNLSQKITSQKKFNQYNLSGKNKKDIIIHIDRKKHFKTFKTKSTEVKTDIFDKKIDFSKTQDIIAREVDFIESYLGKHPHSEILVDANTVNKNSLHETYGLPKWLKPYPENFRWEMRFFKALTAKYIDKVLLLNQRKDYWLNNGIETFLMMEYLKKYYPNVTFFGKYSKIWGFKGYNLAKLKQSEKFSILYQFSARKFYDQPLTMRADSLSNFNRKIVSRYKAGLGLKYLQGYIGDSLLKSSLKELYNSKKLKIASSKVFETILKKKTNKNLDWFFGDFLQTSKKIDYTIEDTKVKSDSIEITLKNKRKITAPVALYGVKDKKIVFKKWITDIDSTKTLSITKGNFDRLALNYENLYPEYNTLDNFKSLKKRLFNKPIQFRLLEDIENPYYNQIYFQPEFKYNFYDGLILKSTFHNQPIIPRNFAINISPSYGLKSSSLSGSFNVGYNNFASQESKIYKTVYGIGGSYQHYDNNLAYKSFGAYTHIDFKRNSLRDVGAKFLNFSIKVIDKEIPENEIVTDKDKYAIFSVRYFNNKPNVIKGTQYNFAGEVSTNFSKLMGEFKYRKLTGAYRRMEFRAYAGLFLHNKTTDNYFSFGLDRANDYQFQLNYFGRSEESGILSQQFIMAEGGFKSKLDTRFANQFLVSFNSSIGIWRWIEVYNDVAFLKNKNQGIFTGYENGIRLNFVPNIFELYFPIYSNNGWEIANKSYETKIRFVLTANLGAVYNFFRRGLL